MGYKQVAPLELLPRRAPHPSDYGPVHGRKASITRQLPGNYLLLAGAKSGKMPDFTGWKPVPPRRRQTPHAVGHGGGLPVMRAHARRRAWARLTRRQPPHARARALPETNPATSGRSPIPLKTAKNRLCDLCILLWPLKPLCLSLPFPAPASVIRATHCASAFCHLKPETFNLDPFRMLAANAFLKINAKKTRNALAANNPVFRIPVILASDAGLPPSSPEGESK